MKVSSSFYWTLSVDFLVRPFQHWAALGTIWRPGQAVVPSNPHDTFYRIAADQLRGAAVGKVPGPPAPMSGFRSHRSTARSSRR